MKPQKQDFRQLYKKIKTMPPSKRVQSVNSKEGQHWLSLLTPTQFAQLFPDYYKKQLPDVGLTRAASGGVILGGQSPTFGGGSATPVPSSGGGRSSGGSWRPRGSSTATPAPPDPTQVLKKQIEEKTGIKPTAASLAEERKIATEKLSVETKKHMFALAVAEVGDNPEAQQKVMETIYNRFHSEKKASLEDTMKRDYYEPLRPEQDPKGWQRYQNALKKIESDPDFFKKLDEVHANVIAGSNSVNYGTHNASGTVLADARRGGYDSIPETVREESGEGWYNKKRDKKWLNAKREAEKDITGSTDTNNFPLTPDGKPDGMNESTQKYYDSLSDSEKKIFGKQVQKLGGMNNMNEMADKIIAKTSTGDLPANSKAVEIALRQKGLNEVSDREQLKDFLDNAGKGAKVDPSDAWCASFVNSSLEQAGIQGTNSGAAGSFHAWGEKVTKPEDVKAGDVLVNNIRSPRTGMKGSHVVLATGPAFQDEKGNWHVPTVGGNQALDGTSEGKKTQWVSETSRPFDSWAVRRASPEYYREPQKDITGSTKVEDFPLTPDEKPTVTPAPSVSTPDEKPTVTPAPSVSTPSQVPSPPPSVTPAPAPTPPGMTSPQVPQKQEPSQNVLPPVDVPQNQSKVAPTQPKVQEMTRVEPRSPSESRAYAQSRFENRPGENSTTTYKA